MEWTYCQFIGAFYASPGRTCAGLLRQKRGRALGQLAGAVILARLEQGTGGIAAVADERNVCTASLSVFV